MLESFCRTQIIFQNKTQFLKELLENKYDRIAIIISARAAERFGLSEYLYRLQENKRCIWIKDSVSYPTPDVIQKGLIMLQGFEPQIIVAIGGGSTLDYAKCMKAFFRKEKELSQDQILEQIRLKKIINNKIELVAVPTTSGTGAELTKWATVWDKENIRKYSVEDETLKPDKAIIVKEFLVYMDAALTVTTALDSLSHAVESYWARQTNPLVQSLALQSIRIICENLSRTLENLENEDYREQMAIGSLLSGLAFSVTRTTACHSISYPLTMLYGIPHGVAVAMTLSEVMKINSGYYGKEKQLADVFQEYGGIVFYLQKTCDGIISLRLSDYGVKKEDLSMIVNYTCTLGRMDNNPVFLDHSQIMEILEHIY